ncbi:MAG: (Fe-S)-binding protein [Methanomassiliicoccales archaeon]|jgi:Fe-S oxidoreductase|nr:(Fe-S)-binding protein [Methanomassiliicoccales archaeon]
MDKDRIEEYGIRQCIDCGKCSWACPVSHRENDFSPRSIVENLLVGDKKLLGREMWDCVTCGTCSALCNSNVKFHEFMRTVRKLSVERASPMITHGDIFNFISLLSSKPYLRPRTLNWLSPDIKVSEDSRALLFVGCTPYLNIIFKNLNIDFLQIPRAAVKLLNAVGIEPRVLESERCCGHDQYWLGNDDLFIQLAGLNLKAIESSGAEEVITFCPECYSTLKFVYPRFFGSLDFEVRNLTAMMGDAVDSGVLSLTEDSSLSTTFHDPCRLAKHSNIIEEPRRVLRAIGRFFEMPRSRHTSVCCGVASWVNCDSWTKRWQLERIEEARATGAGALVTACPKCLAHLSCAQYEKNSCGESRRFDIVDIHVLAASRIFSTE